MHPTVRDGDLVTVAPFGARGPRRGEVVFYADAEGRFVAHRVVSVSNETVVTRGDALAADDPRVAREALLGRVVAVAPRRPIFYALDLVARTLGGSAPSAIRVLLALRAATARSLTRLTPKRGGEGGRRS